MTSLGRLGFLPFLPSPIIPIVLLELSFLKGLTTVPIDVLWGNESLKCTPLVQTQQFCL